MLIILIMEKVINILKQMNYSVFQEKDFQSNEAALNGLMNERNVVK